MHGSGDLRHGVGGNRGRSKPSFAIGDGDATYTFSTSPNLKARLSCAASQLIGPADLITRIRAVGSARSAGPGLLTFGLNFDGANDNDALTSVDTPYGPLATGWIATEADGGILTLADVNNASVVLMGVSGTEWRFSKAGVQAEFLRQLPPTSCGWAPALQQGFGGVPGFESDSLASCAGPGGLQTAFGTNNTIEVGDFAINYPAGAVLSLTVHYQYRFSGGTPSNDTWVVEYSFDGFASAVNLENAVPPPPTDTTYERRFDIAPATCPGGSCDAVDARRLMLRFRTVRAGSSDAINYVIRCADLTFTPAGAACVPPLNAAALQCRAEVQPNQVVAGTRQTFTWFFTPIVAGALGNTGVNRFTIDLPPGFIPGAVARIEKPLGTVWPASNYSVAVAGSGIKVDTIARLGSQDLLAVVFDAIAPSTPGSYRVNGTCSDSIGATAAQDVLEANATADLFAGDENSLTIRVVAGGDAGSDGGVSDAGVSDAGGSDAGSDGGMEPDAGAQDAGTDAGASDAGRTDGGSIEGTPDGGPIRRDYVVGCGCQSVSGGLCPLLLLVLRRSRRCGLSRSGARPKLPAQFGVCVSTMRPALPLLILASLFLLCCGRFGPGGPGGGEGGGGGSGGGGGGDVGLDAGDSGLADGGAFDGGDAGGGDQPLPGFDGGELRDAGVRLTYQGLSGELTGTCSVAYPILAFAPPAAGTYPLFIHFAGTNEPYDDLYAQGVIRMMSLRGFVGASIDYPHHTDDGCLALRNKLDCALGASHAQSAISALCALPKVDCSKGIAVEGISQGSQMAAMAANYDNRVRAAYALSTGDVLTVGFNLDMKACMDVAPAGNRALPNDAIRAVNGEVDQLFGASQPPLVRAELQRVAGVSCGADAGECLNPNGTGWYLVRQPMLLTQTHKADHLYMVDPGFAPPYTFAWSMVPNLDWLASAVTGTPTAGHLQFEQKVYRSDAGSAVIGVSRSGGATGAASISYATTDGGSAVPGVDFSAVSGTLNWTDGDATPKSFSVPLAASAAGKAIALSLSAATGAAQGVPASATLDVGP